MKDAPTVLFRCDATDGGGIGHLVRCIALSQALRARGADAVHLSGEVSAPLGRAMLAGEAIRLHPPTQGAQGLIVLAETLGAPVVHVDHYGDFDGLRSAGRARGILTSTATDERFGRRDADVIIDGSPRSLRDFDVLYGDAAVGLGPAYLALREEFAAPLAPSVAGGGVAVLVVMGGTDAAGYGTVIADAVARVDGVTRVGLVGGDPRELDNAFLDGRVEQIPRRRDFRALIGSWDLVVTGAGTTVWELAALGKPMAVVGVAENQQDHYETLVTRGLAIGLGFLPNPDAIDTEAVAAMVADPVRRRRMAERAQHLVDGRGSARVVDLWEVESTSASEPGMGIRPAGAGDTGRLFAWRSDPATRRASRSTDPLDWARHQEWFAQTLARTDRRLFIGSVAGDPVGTTRFDRVVDGEWEVSVTVAPHARGRGWASRLVAESMTKMLGGDQPVTRIVAELREENGASRAVFSRLGYRLERADAEWERWSVEPTRLRSNPT